MHFHPLEGVVHEEKGPIHRIRPGPKPLHFRENSDRHQYDGASFQSLTQGMQTGTEPSRG